MKGTTTTQPKKQEFLESDPSFLKLKRQKFAKSFFSSINSNNAWNHCSNNDFLFEYCAREGAVREPPGGVIECSFHLVAIFFSMIFMTLFFAQSNAQKSSKKWPKILSKSSWNLTLGWFSLIFCTSCFWTTLQHFYCISLVRIAPNCKKNISKARLKNHMFFTTTF